MTGSPRNKMVRRPPAAKIAEPRARCPGCGVEGRARASWHVAGIPSYEIEGCRCHRPSEGRG